MDRRSFIRNGIGSMATMAVGDLILLNPSTANAMAYRPIGDGNQRKIRNNYKTATRAGAERS